MLPVILAGGSGTRLWPLSRTQFPKQFLPLHSDFSLLQDTVKRLDEVTSVTLICNEQHRFLAAEQMRQINQKASIILEPIGRDTAPAITLAALEAIHQGRGDENLLVLAADHIIIDNNAFREAITKANELATIGQLVTFGIVPDRAHTGYGYIKKGGASEKSSFHVDSFVEKPDLSTAQTYLDSGEYLWNSGMFMFRADRFITEIEKYRPDILEACQLSIEGRSTDNDFIRVKEEAFKSCPKDSVDYAVMEKTDNAVVIPLDAGWNDLGNWDAIWETHEKDKNSNAIIGDTMVMDTQNSLVYSDDRLVCALGVEDLVIVDTKDAVLVSHRDRLQDIKTMVADLKQKNRMEHFQHREVYRPWGKYDSVDQSSRFQVKRITVNPGAKLSVQMHHHRAEHWIVVSGTAKVNVDGKDSLITENESIYIPITAIHSLENPGKVPLELIEVQVGSYLGEDDIVRFEDKYGRT